ncbi:MAG: hypothetical protein QXL19_07695 [Ignisphaera sp.]
MGSIEPLTRYIVVKILSGRRDIVDLIYEYFVYNESPTTLAHRYGMTVNQIKNYIQRVMEKTFSSYRAKVLLKYIYPYAIRIEPIINRNICKICREYVFMPESHIISRHRDIIDTYTMKIISEVFTWMKH